MNIKSLQKDVNKATKELGRVNDTVQRQSKSFQQMRNDVVRTVRQLETLYVAYKSIETVMGQVVSKGVELNKMYEDQALGISALVSAKVDMLDASGKELNSYEKFIAVQGMTKNVMNDIKQAALQTPASFQQMVGFYQQAIGHAITENKTFGDSIDEVNKNVIKFTQRMSALGAAAGMEMPKINEEIRSLMSGNASTDSLLAMMLFGSPSAANQAVREAKKHTDGLSKLLLDALEPFKNVEGVMTYTKAMAQLGAVLDDIRRAGTSGLFEDLKDLAQEFTGELKQDFDSISKFWDEFYGVIRADIISGVDLFDDIKTAVGNIFEALGHVSNLFEALTGGTWTWHSALIAVKQLVALLVSGLNGIAIAFNGIRMAAIQVQKMAGVYGELTDNEEKLLAQHKRKIKLYDEESKQYKYHQAEIERLTKKKEGLADADADIAKIQQENIKLRQQSQKQRDDAFSKEGRKREYIKLEAYKRELQYIRQIKEAKTEAGRVAAVEAALKNAKGVEDNYRMVKKIGDAYRETVQQAEILARIQGGTILQKGGVGAGGGGNGSGAANSRAELKLINDMVELERQKNELKYAQLEKEYTMRGLLLDEYSMRADQIRFAKIEAELAWETYRIAVKTAGKHANEATVQKKLIALKIKAVKLDTKYWKLVNKNINEFNKQMRLVGRNFTNNLIGGDLKGAFKSLLDDIIGVFVKPLQEEFSKLFGDTMTSLIGSFYDQMVQKSVESTAQAVAQAQIEGSAKAAVGVANQATGDPYTAFARMAAMAAAMAALGFMVNGSFGGGSSHPSAPSYDAVRRDPTKTNYEGKYLSRVEYSKVTELMGVLNTGFDDALKKLNELNNEAHQIWTEAFDAMSKFKYKIKDYAHALDMTRAVGSWDKLNKFYDNFMSQGEKIDALRFKAKMLYTSLGVELPKSIDDAKQAVVGLMNLFRATGNIQYLSAASDFAEAANAFFDFNTAAEEAASSVEQVTIEMAKLSDIAKLQADWMDSMAGAKLILSAVIKETGLSGINAKNFLAKFKAASSGGMTQEDLDKWAQLSDALKSLQDAENELIQKRIDAVNNEINFYEEVKRLIDDAYLGSLSYLNSMEKAQYAAEKAQEAINAGDTATYFSELGKQIEYEKKMSVTKEEYMLKFNDYIEKLQSAEYVPEKTTDDVVDELELANTKLDNLLDAIEKASYQGALS